MVRSEILRFVPATLLLSLVGVSGCGALSALKFPDLNDLLGSSSQVRDEEGHRQKYQLDRDPAERNWLLANRIQNGMAVSEVSRVIGEDGQRVHNDGRVKKGGGHYQSGDKAWKWAADRNSQSLILVFREGLLVNFDPSEYQSRPDPNGF